MSMYLAIGDQPGINIQSTGYLTDLISCPSNDDIYRTFTSFKDYQIISCVDYFPKAGYVQCHVYSCPYTLTHYNNITNNFPGGLFNNVQEIELFDERPFEHEFFIQISQTFPFLKVLLITNKEPQTLKQEQEAHDDYAEQFLFDTKTRLSNSIRLGICYDQLQRVTQNFTRDATRYNCSKIEQLFLREDLELPQQYNTSFPNLE